MHLKKKKQLCISSKSLLPTRITCFLLIYSFLSFTSDYYWPFFFSNEIFNFQWSTIVFLSLLKSFSAKPPSNTNTDTSVTFLPMLYAFIKWEPVNAFHILWNKIVTFTVLYYQGRLSNTVAVTDSGADFQSKTSLLLKHALLKAHGVNSSFLK